MLGDNIRKFREACGYSQTELAEMLGIKKQTLFKYEHNIVTNVPLNMVEKIAAVLSIDPAVLTGWSRSPETRYMEYLKKLARLDADDRARIDERVDTMLEAEKYQED